MSVMIPAPSRTPLSWAVCGPRGKRIGFGKSCPKSKKMDWMRQTSIFNAWSPSQMGGKLFIMAVWQTGVTWAPPPDLLQNNYYGAVEHVAKHFASWTRRLARAVTRHKQHPKTEEARIRSGNSYGTHGLTEQDLQDRIAREKAREDFHWAAKLNKSLQASKGKGKGAKPKAWCELSKNEHWWLKQFWNGNLKKTMQDAEAKCHPIGAPHFVM